MSPLTELTEQLRSNPIDFAADADLLRQDFGKALASIPVPEHLRFRELIVGGVEALECTTDRADTSRVLLYLHGGGYAAGSAQGYRALWGQFGEAAGVRALAPEYRLAPEHPFPAAIEDTLAVYRALLAAYRRIRSIASRMS